MTIEDIAKCCHELNRSYCAGLGDFSQPCWEDAPNWQRDSAICGVKFHLENPLAGPSGSHDNWLKDKLEDGWVYGEIKDVEKKTHPCCVPYEDLPLEQKLKDSLFVHVVHTLKVLL